MVSKHLKVILWLGILSFALSSAAWCQYPMKAKTGKGQANGERAEYISLPKHLDAEQIDTIIAGLSDEQVRKLLINELKAQAQQETIVQAKPEGIAGFIEKIKDLTALLQARIELLRSGGSAAPQVDKGIYFLLGEGRTRDQRPYPNVILSVAAVLAGALLIEWVFVSIHRGGAAAHHLKRAFRMDRQNRGPLFAGPAGFCGHRHLHCRSPCHFFPFSGPHHRPARPLAAYLAGLVFVQGACLVLRFFLAPRAAGLRLLPFSDPTAMYLYHWLMALSFVVCMGEVTDRRNAPGRRRRDDGHQILDSRGFIVAGMLIWMLLQKRKSAASRIQPGAAGIQPALSIGAKVAPPIHRCCFAVVGCQQCGSLILGTDSGQAILTLLMVPLYFMLDWILRLMLETVLGIARHPEARAMPAEAPSADQVDDDASEVARPVGSATAEETSANGQRLDLERMKGPLKFALRLSLAALLFFWILKIWSIGFPVGETVVKTIVMILLVVLLCYLAWGLINAAIQRRMQQEIPETEEDEANEEGGSGGSRIATLLVLLRKFMLVVIIVMASLIVLSALGVNIGPLIAGAGVFGLAIGFGAQTLVKDIISGVFFLIDDAFRVGDYLTVSGTKGTVEHISLRSLRLRHPRGMVYFIPFGDMKTVTNLSRDYVIMKLDFRVRYDADVEKIRKIIKKKVYKVISADPELGPKLLEPIKSQGVREMDDSAMIMRVKYKTKPGDQFAIRKHVYRLMQEAFKEEGIEFAHRNVTVYMPPEPDNKANAQPPVEKQPDAATANNEIQRQAAAAAALTAIQAEEEAAQAAKKTKK
jgi:small-conductance mechanosensitive channel